ncbi:MAG: SH3 domain-containing protein [Desulfovibrionaceae bacterium]|nr:SH3 domain-containing protein [Desulfovibrionaceae bacterium]
MNAFLRLSCLFLLLLGLSACGGKHTPSPSGPYSGPPCLDVLTYPQNLHAYVDAAGGAKPLLTASEQAAAAQRQKEAWYRPWRLSKPARWIEQSLAKNFNLSLASGYTNNREPFPADVWDALVANSNKKAFGKGAGPAITLRGANLRAMPSNRHFYLRPDLPGEGYPFDYFQHTSTPPGTPVYICNVSKDGQWVLVDGPVTTGWVPAGDVARVDPAFMEHWQSRPLAAIVRDGTAVGAISADTGALLPLAVDAAPGLDRALSVLYPVRGADGRADAARADLAPGAATAVPLPLTAQAVAEVGNPMLGQAYGWGGLDGRRDCSALTRDLFAPFGIHLPRNSANQAKAGRTIELGGLSNEEKERLILAEAAPFRSLIWFKGHIGVYLGAYEGKAMYFHNMWGLRTKDANGGCDNRAIVGKGVITTLRPGVERPDLCSPGSFLDRIEKVAVLPH